MSASNPLRNVKISFDPTQDQEEFEVEFYGILLQQSPDNVDVMRRQAELMARRGEDEKALDLDRRLVRLCPSDPVARYNLTCSLSKTNEPNAAIDALEQAIALGYHDFAQIEIDSDLDPIREHPRFVSLMKACGWE